MGKRIGLQKFDVIPFIFSSLFLVDVYVHSGQYAYSVIGGFIAIMFIIAVARNAKDQLIVTSYSIITALYLSLFLGSWIMLRENRFVEGYKIGGYIVGSAFISVWILDTMAYFTGKMFGKHKLFPSVSPNKTVEGGIGGVLGAVSAMLAAKYVFFNQLSIVHAVLIGGIIGIVGQLGDVIESFLKRQTGAKDSSSILPGHGGIFDRFDSIIFVGPFVYAYVWLFLQEL